MFHFPRWSLALLLSSCCFSSFSMAADAPVFLMADMATPSTAEQQQMPFVRTDKAVYAPQETVVVEYGHLPGNDKDWISVVPSSFSDDGYTRNWQYTHKATEGQYVLETGLEEGDYEARVYFDYPKGGMVVQSRYRFTVAKSAEAAEILLNSAKQPAIKAQQLFDIRAQLICRTINEIPNSECLSLFKLFSATNGKEWKHNDGWNLNNRPCNWYGVSCRDNHVVALRLPNNGLAGELPDLNALTQLEVLWLSNNQLTGELPDLNGLTQLQKLYLNGNAFSGTLPVFTKLTALRNIHIYSNEFTGSLPDLSALVNLEAFYAHENKFTGIIPNLTTLINLEEVDLSYNQLTGPLPDLNQLRHLQYLSLEENQITGEFPDISALLGLEGLFLDQNQLCGVLPSTLPETHPALSLTVSYNHFSSQDEALINFINIQEPDWIETQTVCPTEESSAQGVTPSPAA